MQVIEVNSDIHLDWVDDDEWSYLQNGDMLRIWSRQELDVAKIYLPRTMAGEGDIGRFRKSQNPLVAALLDAGESLWIRTDDLPNGDRKFQLVREDREGQAQTRRLKILKPRKLPIQKVAEITYLEGWKPNVGDRLIPSPTSIEFHCKNPYAPIDLENNRGVHVAGIWAQGTIREIVLHACAARLTIDIVVSELLRARPFGNPFWMAEKAQAKISIR